MRLDIDIDDLVNAIEFPAVIKNAHIKATIKTLNREGNRLKTFLFKSVREEYMIKTSDLKKSSKEIKASYSSKEFSYQLGVSSDPLPLDYFGMREKRVKGNDGIRRKGVSVKIKRKEKRKVVKSGFIHNGHIFKRETERRYPLKYLTSLSIPQMFKEEKIEEGIDLVRENFPKTYYDSLKFYTSKIK